MGYSSQAMWYKLMQATEIVQLARKNGEFDRLLLGDSKYSYRPQNSPARGNTDLTILLEQLYMESDSAKMLLEAIVKISSTPEGAYPIATCIMFESLKMDSNMQTGLDLEHVCLMLKENIQQFWRVHSLSDHPECLDFPDRMLGELRRINGIVQELGGPDFFPKNNIN